MAQKTNSFEKFWQELKRRKTIRVITVYAAASFIILQLVDIIGQPLQLPGWTLTLVIVLLCVGFIIAILLSWVYDITPSGVKKTKPISVAKHSDQITKVASGGWKIATYSSIFIIVGLVVINIVRGKKQTESRTEFEKSIAVLPFKLLTEEPNKQYLADGMMEAILLNLQKFKDLKVLDRTSVEQYRETTKTTNVIIQELDVGYLLEGSFQKAADNVRLNVRLIKAEKQSNMWGKEYDRNWKDIFSVQSEVAKAIADELHAIITPNEMELLGKVATANLTAYDLYLKANDYQKDYHKTNNLSSYQTDVNLYKTSLEIDSAFAMAYTGLAIAYFDKYYYETYFNESFLDSCLTLINKALSYDDHLDEAYYLKGLYFGENGHIEEALNNYDQTLNINPNYYLAYLKRGDILTQVLHDLVRGIENYQKALTLIRGEDRPSLLRRLGNVFVNVGFTEKGKYYYQEALALDGNKLDNSICLELMEFVLGNFEEALKLDKKCLEIDTTYLGDMISYSLLPGHNNEGYLLAKKYVESSKKSGTLNLQASHRIGYAFWQVGKIKEAKNYFNQQIKYDEEIIKLGRDIAQSKSAQYDLAGTFAFLGDKEKAYQYLDEFSKQKSFPLWWVTITKYDPLFNNIRSEERFQKILQDMEAKYQAEHERVRKWLEETGQL